MANKGHDSVRLPAPRKVHFTRYFLMRGELDVHVVPKGDRAAEVALEGSVDAHTVDRFRQALADLVEAGTLRIVLDLSKLEYVSSVGLNVLINARSDLRKSGGDLLLAGVPSHVLTIFRMLGLFEVLGVAPTVDEAWAAVGREWPPPPPKKDT